MSQNDYVIGNQSAPDFRADLNDALQALASLSSGSTAPSTTYANMLWYDTGTNILYMRTEADDDWIEVGSLDQTSKKFFPAGAVPAGSIIYRASATAPDGYLKANGAAVSRTTYSALFTAIGTTWGAGDGSTTFNLPDLRGEFPRGWDDARGLDSGRGFGTVQGDAIRNITGNIYNNFTTSGADGAFAETNLGNSNVWASGVAAGRFFHNTFSAARVVPTAAENRPRNVALLACIKF